MLSLPVHPQDDPIALLERRVASKFAKSPGKGSDYYDPDDEGYESGVVPEDASNLQEVERADKGRVKVGGGGELEGAVEAFPKKTRRKKPPAPVPLQHPDGEDLLLTLPAIDKLLTSLPASDHPSDTPLPPPSTWESLGVHPSLIASLPPAPLPSQSLSIPPVLAGTDTVIAAHTGSGKTLAFLLPVLTSLLASYEAHPPRTSSAPPFAIVVAPGRELCSQINAVLSELLPPGSPVKTALAIGGTSYQSTATKLRKTKPSVVVATPGRLGELLAGGALKAHGVRHLVLDEFDSLLLSSATRESTEGIVDLVRRASKNATVVLASATAGDMREGQIGRFVRPDAVTCELGSSGRNKRAGESAPIEALLQPGAPMMASTLHGVVKVARDQLKLELLRKIFSSEPSPGQVLVFVNDARRVGLVVDRLADMNIVAAPLSGDMEKNERADVSRALREGRVGCVVATEIAARGLDAPSLTHVVNLDLPTDASHYCHRAGRCGRGGRPGVVVSIASGGKEHGVLHRFGKELRVGICDVDVRGGKLNVFALEGGFKGAGGGDGGDGGEGGEGETEEKEETEGRRSKRV
ncbi:hypothetical protein TeGR_g4131 [Tetraparma gracilis]|uniref:P-loop containing nucleoside triphosphate hydrolase protein n=1 Tax=Tetraparma gracilis TaxID=2962635 RepID=A0ABQ6MV54_9STRA|nr:hypothetical protein TeGR_g4131 [Tetraparma gracilis]